MTEASNSPSRSPERNVAHASPATHGQDQWVISGMNDLREDVRELRKEALERTKKRDDCLARIEGSLVKLDKKLEKKQDAASVKLEAKLDGLFAKLEARIDGAHSAIEAKFTPIDARLTSIEKTLSRVVWMGSGIALAGTLLASAYFILSIFVDISFTPKPPAEAAVSAPAE